MNTLSQRFTPRVKRFVIVGGTALILITLIFATSRRSEPVEGQRPENTQQVVDFTGVPPKELTLNRISADLEQLHKQQLALQEQHQQTLEQLQQQVQSLRQNELVEVQATIVEESTASTDSVPDVLTWNTYNQPPPSDYSEHFETAPTAPKPIRMLGASFNPSMVLNAQPKPDTKTTGKTQLLRLPAGSLLSGQLITGLDVPTGQGARREPYPVLIRINASAILPNHYRTNVRECFVLASGYGDLSSERAYLRSETLSCILKRQGEEQFIERQLEGYVTGEDGKAGLRGRLVSKQGQVMAKAAMAGFLSGVSEAFDIKPVPVFSVAPNKNGEIQSPFQSGLKGSQALQSSLVKGSNKALEKLADFYLKLADQMVPVIEISAERSVDLILTRGLKP